MAAKEPEREFRPSIYLFHYNPPEIPSDDEFTFEPTEFAECHCEENYKPECKRELEIKREEHTLAIIKPSARPHTAAIVRRIQDEGFTILKRMQYHLFPEQATDFFKKDYGRTWFPKVMLKISSGPITVMILAKDNAVEDLKKLVGPRKVSLARQTAPMSLRSLYGLKGDEASNGIHASSSVDDARREIHYFFENVIPEPVWTVTEKMNFIHDKYYSFLLEGLTELCKMKPYNPSMWFVNWLANQNPVKPVVSMPPYPTAAEVESARYERYKKMHIEHTNKPE